MENLDDQILKHAKGKAKNLYEDLSSDKRVKDLLKQANTVAVTRLDLNDHGEVHAKIVTLNSLKILDLLLKKKIKPYIVKEKVGSIEDVQIVLILASYFHDIGMAVMREDHEKHSIILASDLIKEYLSKFCEKPERLIGYIYEGILCHMGKNSTSIEAGIVAVADGCDMTKGRSRIAFTHGFRNIHEYSARAIEEVKILPGRKKKIKIEIKMSSSSGVFQVENVLLPKIRSSVLKDFIEVVSIVNDFGKVFKDYEW